MRALAVVVGLALVAMPRRATAQEVPPDRLSVYLSSGGAAYLSSARTLAGLGGGVGLRGTLRERFIFQADCGYLIGIGNVFEARVAAGIQRSGVYAPALLLALSGLVGEHLSFLTPQHPTAVAGPAVSLGVAVAPLRFITGAAQFSLLELGVGIGTDFPGWGLSLRVDAAEVSVSF